MGTYEIENLIRLIVSSEEENSELGIAILLSDPNIDYISLFKTNTTKRLSLIINKIYNREYFTNEESAEICKYPRFREFFKSAYQVATKYSWTAFDEPDRYSTISSKIKYFLGLS